MKYLIVVTTNVTVESSNFVQHFTLWFAFSATPVGTNYDWIKHNFYFGLKDDYQIYFIIKKQTPAGAEVRVGMKTFKDSVY